jgi:hypothetical protein
MYEKSCPRTFGRFCLSITRWTIRFAPGSASEKPCRQTIQVPGSPEIAYTIFDVSQALSWVATSRENAEERLNWQTGIPKLINKLIIRKN